LEILGAALDITDRYQWEEQREFLLQELNHRVKNAVAVTQAVASMTLKRHCEPQYWRVFEERILAMVRAQNELIRRGWERADLHELAVQTLAPYLASNDRITFNGEPVDLPGRDAMNVAMALHELSTNAAKYGALSVETGKVQISWVVDKDRVQLCWQEIDGPAISKPTANGFGLNVINLADIDRRADINFDKSGLRVMLALPRCPVRFKQTAPEQAIAALELQ
jgi:two-component sensor histidine kinase